MRISKVLLGVLLLVTACSQTKETPNGFKYKLVKEGQGSPATQDQLIVFNFKITDSKDSVWADTYKRGFPEFTAVPDSSQSAEQDGISQMLCLLKKGDSSVFDISVKKLFKEMAKSAVPPGIDTTLNLNYSVSIRDIIAKEQFEEYRGKIEAEYYALEEKNAKQQLDKDTLAIDEYLKSKGIDAAKLPSGIRYVITTAGEASNAVSGQTVLVNYAGYLMDGTCFDTNVKAVAEEKGIYDPVRAAQAPYEPFEVVIDQTNLIQGWHEALKQLGKGGKGTFYIPSTLAYGSRRMGNKIKENSSLVFDIEMVDIKDQPANP
ncbi:MAG TPA: FKBP-type peptidyl-prolyl cis-trans isomerase [Cyclobacteriaceae bacterium]|nr:FKBP-type peptidyl-prolyl cis-trans isomerase [Cyclobacteriaceae bacterium]